VLFFHIKIFDNTCYSVLRKFRWFQMEKVSVLMVKIGLLLSTVVKILKIDNNCWVLEKENTAINKAYHCVEFDSMFDKYSK